MQTQGESSGDILCSQLSNSDQRALVFHLLYAVDSMDYEVSLESVADNFGREYNMIINKDCEVFTNTLDIIKDRDKLDALVVPLLSNWRVERLGVCTRLILRMSIWELLQKKLDSAIIINEAIELAKCFAEKDAYKFVNGILDELLKRNMLDAKSD